MADQLSWSVSYGLFCQRLFKNELQKWKFCGIDGTLKAGHEIWAKILLEMFRDSY